MSQSFRRIMILFFGSTILSGCILKPKESHQASQGESNSPKSLSLDSPAAGTCNITCDDQKRPIEVTANCLNGEGCGDAQCVNVKPNTVTNRVCTNSGLPSEGVCETYWEDGIMKGAVANCPSGKSCVGSNPGSGYTGFQQSSCTASPTPSTSGTPEPTPNPTQSGTPTSTPIVTPTSTPIVSPTST